MKRRAFVLDLARCFGCQGCVAACANANGLAPEASRRRLLKLPPEDGLSDTIYLSLACSHCAAAPCLTACPSRALTRRAADGLVLHDADRCLGCRYCEMACPYAAIRYDAARRVVDKCDFCAERLDQGEEPACVATCFSGALASRLIDPDEPKGPARDAPGFTHHAAVRPMIRFAKRGGA